MTCTGSCITAKSNILVIDDSEDDEFLIGEFIKREMNDVSVMFARDKKEYLIQLGRTAWDCIICDHNMAQFNSTEALNCLRERNINTPFIIVSGDISEEQALSTMDHGSCDYVFKDNLDRLPHIIKREIEKANAVRIDPLTGLMKREFFHRQIGIALEHAKENNTALVLILIDIDKFKLINNGMGFVIGDELLKKISHKLETMFNEACISRISGNQFGLLVNDIPELSTLATYTKIIKESLMTPMMIHDQVITCTASIGISIFPIDSKDTDTMVLNAERAMYSVKAEGGNDARHFSDDLNIKPLKTIQIHNALNSALKNNQFFMVYQPKVDIQSGAVTSVEALIRWDHPELGIVPPIDFIPLTEANGMIIDISRWVLKETCEQFIRWQESGIKLENMAVNISTRHFRRALIVDDVVDAINKTGIDASCLELEITEGALMDNTTETMSTLKSLKEIGVKLSIDDFGTGYSSLSYLKDFPIDTLKIDRSFIMELMKGKNMIAIVASIISLAENLKLETVAEGIEDMSEYKLLKEMGCSHAQGFALGKPMKPEDFVQYMEKYGSNATRLPA